MKPKVDLNVLKTLIEQLEAGLSKGEEILKTDGHSTSDYVVEMSKTAGLAAGISQEAAMLVADIQALIRINSAPVPETSVLEKMFGSPLKGIKGFGNGNSN